MLGSSKSQDGKDLVLALPLLEWRHETWVSTVIKAKWNTASHRAERDHVELKGISWVHKEDFVERSSISAGLEETGGHSKPREPLMPTQCIWIARWVQAAVRLAKMGV